MLWSRVFGRQEISTRVRGTLLLAVLGVVSFGVMALLPARHQSSEIKWEAGNPTRPSQQIASPLILSRHQAAKISMLIPCMSPMPEERTRVFGTSRNPEDSDGLLVIYDKNRLEFYIGYAIQTSIVFNKSGACPVKLSLTEGRQLELTNSLRHVVHHVSALPVVTGLHVLSDDLVFENTFRVDISTFESAYKPSNLQYIFLIFGLLSSICGVWLLYSGRVRLPWRTQEHRSPFASASVILGLCFYVIFGPVAVDDGWVVQIAENPINFWHFTPFQQAWDSRTPTGLLTCWIYWLWIRIDNSLLWIRLLPLLLTVTMYFVCRRILTLTLGRLSRGEEATLVTFTLIFGWSWLLTMRSEPTIALLSAVVLLNTIKFNKAESVFNLLLAGVAASTAFTLHPSGSVAFAPLVVSLPSIFAYARPRLDRALSVLSAMFLSLSTVILFLFGGWGFAELRATSTLWNGYIQRGWRDEFERYVAMFSGGSWDTFARRMSFVLIVSVVILTMVVRNEKIDLQKQIAGLSATIALFFLPLTQTKWPWHFGAISAFVLIGLTTELRRVNRGFGIITRIGLALSFLVATSICAQSPDLWGIFAFVSPPLRLIDEMREAVTVIPLLFSVLALALLLSRVRSRVWRLSLLPVIMVTLCVPLALTSSSLVSDSFANRTTWSIGKQNLQTLTRHDECGLGRWVHFADPLQAKPLISVDKHEEFPPSFAKQAVRMPPAKTSFAAADRNLYVSTSDPKRVIYSTGSWYELPARGHSMFVEARGTFTWGEHTLFVQLSSSKKQWTFDVTDKLKVRPFGSDTVTVDLGDLRERLNSRDSEEGMLVVRIGVSQQAAAGSSLEFSEPRSAPIQPLLDHVRRGLSVSVDPFFRMYFPCLKEEPMKSGIRTVPDLVIGPIPLQGTSALQKAVYEVGIVELSNAWASFLSSSPTSSDTPPLQRLIPHGSNGGQSALTIKTLWSD